jgi:MFS family permease
MDGAGVQGGTWGGAPISGGGDSPDMITKAGAPKRFPVCRMFSLLAFGFAFGEMMSNFGLIMLPAEGSYMEPQNSAFMLGFLLILSGVSQFSGPVAGYFSDRCQASMGRRRPYLIVAGLIAVPALVAMGWAHEIYTNHCVWQADSTDCFTEGGSSSGNGGGGNAATTAQAVMFCGFFLVAMMAFNVQMQMLPSLISDLIPEEQTGQATGVIGVLQLVGSLIGFLLYQFISGGFGKFQLPFSVGGDDSIPVKNPIGKMYYYYAPVIALCTIITLLSAKEKPHPIPKGKLPPATCAGILNCFYLSPTLHRDFFIVTVSRTAYYCGLSTMTFLQYYFRDLVRESPAEGHSCDGHTEGSDCSVEFGGHLNASAATCTGSSHSWVFDKFGSSHHGHCIDDTPCTCPVSNYVAKTALIAVIAQAGACVSVYPSGVLSDRIGRKPMVYAACLGMGTIYALMPFVTSLEYVLICGFGWGFFNGLFQPVDFALAIDTLPNQDEVARFLGVWAMAAFVGTTVGPAAGMGMLIALGHVPDGHGNGGDEGAGISLVNYHYSQYGYIGVMMLGLFWNVLACVIVSKVRGCK